MNAIIIPSIGKRPWTEYTFSNVKEYCSKYKLGFEILTDIPDELSEGLKGVEGSRKNIQAYAYKLYLVNIFLEKYDRIVVLDDTCMFHSNAPNIFEEVDEDKLGIYVYLNTTHPNLNKKIESSFEAHMKPIRKFQRENNEPNITEQIEKRFNGGVMVYNQSHREIFSLNNILKAKNLLRSLYPQQTLGYYLIQKHDIATQLMCKKWHYVPGEDSGLSFQQRKILKDITPYIKKDNYLIHFTSVYDFRCELIKQARTLI